MPLNSAKVELVRQPLGQEPTKEALDIKGVSHIVITDYAGCEYIFRFVGGGFGGQHTAGIHIEPPKPFDIVRQGGNLNIIPEPF